MNTILLHPTDVLFFRDGRPMTASLAGHGAAWPLPNIINAAFHAALHRAGLDGVHKHQRGARGIYAQNAERDRKFGSLHTAGPFPVNPDGCWFFPRPDDLLDNTIVPSLLPESATDWRNTSSLPKPLRYAAASRLGATKDSSAKAWLSRDAFDEYLRNNESFKLAGHASDDTEFCDVEHSIGIEIDLATGTAGQGESKGKFYSAHYLRLREGWQLGVSAQAKDRDFAEHDGDLVKALLNGTGNRIVIGGQQRVCTAAMSPESALQLPCGINTGFRECGGKHLIKWVLLSPAVWPGIEADAKRKINAHPGGWLPNWIHAQTGEVYLKAGDTVRHAEESRDVWRHRVRQQESICANLVAAIVPKPVVVTGWALPDESGDNDAERNGGACSTHLAVSAGAVYYFEADSVEDARKLADALNWHGTTDGTEIKNRRSTLLGEKGFGLGVCSTWKFFNGVH
jgi:CRISPR-associated protein Cmr3